MRRNYNPNKEQGKSLVWAYLKLQMALFGMRIVTSLIGLVIIIVLIFIAISVLNSVYGIDIFGGIVETWESLTSSLDTIASLT